jgi:hypothetical protein
MTSLSVFTGQRFGRLSVLREVRARDAGGHLRRMAECACDCGVEVAVRLTDLYRGTQASCGCLKREVLTHQTHGLTKHPLYYTWMQMMGRCTDPQHPDYLNYGGRGIDVCPEWHDIAVFITWAEQNLGPRPDGYSLDRYPDNNSGYLSGNVRWATDRQQRRNSRDSLAAMRRREQVFERWQQGQGCTEISQELGVPYWKAHKDIAWIRGRIAELEKVP